jgi:bacteriorhodopsin
MNATMNEPNENPRRYKWPWFALAAVVLFIALAVLWVTLAAEKVEQQRDYSAPIPSGAPAR